MRWRSPSSSAIGASSRIGGAGLCTVEGSGGRERKEEHQICKHRTTFIINSQNGYCNVSRGGSVAQTAEALPGQVGQGQVRIVSSCGSYDAHSIYTNIMFHTKPNCNSTCAYRFNQHPGSSALQHD